MTLPAQPDPRAPARGRPATGPRAIERVPMFGLELSAVTCAQVVDAITRHLRAGASRPLLIDATNAHGMAAACVDDRLWHSMSTYDHLLPDGMPLAWVMRRNGAPGQPSVPGPYLVVQVLANLPRPTRVAVVGGFTDQHDRIVAETRERFPNAEFVLLDDVPPGRVDHRYVAASLERIERSGAELVFVALGVPRQYYWVATAKPNIGPRVVVSVGGALNYLSGDAALAPLWMQRSGLWWAHRLWREPRRLWKRYLVYNSLFLWYLFTREVLPRRLGWRG